MADALLQPLGPAGPSAPARDALAALALQEREPPDGRPHVVAAMIASADGRAAIEGSSMGLGSPADRDVLRELRTAVDCILVGTGTLRREMYAKLLDEHQRAHRVAAGREPKPRVATISRSGAIPVEAPLFAEPDARIEVFCPDGAVPPARGAQVAVHAVGADGLAPSAVLRRLRAELGVRTVLCEGGPRLLRAVAADGCLDDLVLTVAPMLAAGDAPTPLDGPVLEPPLRLALVSVHRNEHHLFLHYTRPGPS
jgi:riboflavin biosynthesis pyrimidine reductase